MNGEFFLLIIPSRFLDDFPFKAFLSVHLFPHALQKLIIVSIGLPCSPGIGLLCSPGTFFPITGSWDMTFLVIVVLVTLASRHVTILLREAMPQLLVLFGQFFNTCCQRLNLLGHLH